MESAFRDLRHAIRSLLGDKGFTFTVILTIAVCIAANTATFSVVQFWCASGSHRAPAAADQPAGVDSPSITLLSRAVSSR
jgi:hypothetical protein